MKKFIFSLLILVSSLLLFAACDYIAAPLLPHSTNNSNGNNNIPIPDSVGYQNVLIEDYTGAGCINCPTMASRAEELIAQYGSRVVFMEVNYGFDANPSSSGPPYNTWDAETAVGDKYGDLFVTASGAYPNALVNRLHVPQNLENLGDSSTMGDTALAAISVKTGTTYTINNSRPGIYIQILTSYNSISSVVTATVNAFFLKAYTGNYNLTVLLTQDSISGPQNDKPAPFSSGFEHRFALRDNISSPWGDAIIIGGAAANQVISKVYTYTIPSSYQSPDSSKPPIASNYKQSYVVAFVYDAAIPASPTYYQIMQVQQKKIYP